MAEAVADCADAEVGFYHVGGVWLTASKGGRELCHGLRPRALRHACGRHADDPRADAADDCREVQRYGEPEGGAPHRPHSDDPYELLVDAEDRALDGRFPKLLEGCLYRVAMNDDIFRNYRALEYTDGRILDDEVAGVLLEKLREDSPRHPDNEARQRVVRLGAGLH